MKKLLVAFVLAIAAGAAIGWTTPSLAQPASRPRLPDFADLVEKVGPAVVNIRTTERANGDRSQLPQFPFPDGLDESDPFYDFFRRFFPPRQRPGPRAPGRSGQGEEVPRGIGSGFIISADGYLLTNHHVVEGADDIYVTLADKRELRGKLIGSDRRTDVALVKVDATNLPFMTIGDSERLRVGEWVLAIGSPFGLDNTVTAGIVSAKSRDTGDYLPFIQTDVAVNPGNSGGPLINLSGEVIGINSQIYSRTGGFMGISFAIPIDEVMRVVEQLRATGRVVRGRIGVGISEVTRDVAGPLGLDRPSGALVRSIEQGGPAENAGLEVGDIILKFDGKTIDRSSDLPRMVGATRPGSTVPIEVWRRGERKQLRVTVAELEPERTARSRSGEPQRGDQPPAVNSLGLAVSDLPEQQKQRLRVRGGVVVDVAEGPAARAGIRQGDILLTLNNEEISNARRFAELVAKLDPSKAAVLLVRRGDSAQFVPLRPEAR
ncbi:MAG: DegQ family serine endoprotease [Burkholderiaceae bacterium]|nr:DegQ family serine endoprotease [Burkholderiaceae bacterium]